LVWWSISIKLWWYVGVFTLNFAPKFNGNTPTYHQSLMEILQHTNKVLCKYSNIPTKFNVNTPTYNQSLIEILLVCWSISIKLWWYVGVFPLNFGGLMEYFH
jgi:hypothetical protein